MTSPGLPPSRRPTYLLLGALVGLVGCKEGIDEDTFAAEQKAKAAAEMQLKSCQDQGTAQTQQIDQLGKEVDTLKDAHQMGQADLKSCQDTLDPYLNPPPPTFLERLQAISGIEVAFLGANNYSITIEQPLDHQNPGVGSFKQRLILQHRSEEAPMVLSTTGYGLFGGPERWLGYQAEPTMLLNANQIVLEHRYFEESTPEHQDPTQLDWSYLTVAQSAADSHRVVEALSAIYTGPWIATGHSKGGMTAIFHYRHYPQDLAGIVPYVAPISFSIDDPRYVTFMSQIGPADGVCRKAFEDFALQIVNRRAEIVPETIRSNPTMRVFQTPVVEAAIANNARSIAWGMWQFYGGEDLCRRTPGPNLPLNYLAQWSQVSPQQLIGEGDVYSSYQYQVAAELGGPSYEAPYLNDALAQIDLSLIPEAAVGWQGQRPQHNPVPMQEVDNFLKQSAQRVVAIYGEWDPWTAAMITVNEANDSRVFMAAKTGHGAGITDLDPADRARAVQMLMGMANRSSLLPPFPADHPVWAKAKESRTFITELMRPAEMAPLR